MGIELFNKYIIEIGLVYNYSDRFTEILTLIFDYQGE